MALRVGVIGGGQLARMMIAPAVELGLDLRVLAEGEGMSAQLAATAVGDYHDLETVRAFVADVFRIMDGKIGRTNTRARYQYLKAQPAEQALAAQYLHSWMNTITADSFG